MMLNEVPPARSSPGEEHRSRRRVLLISYYFPPKAGPGSVRSLKFTRFLGRFGWDPVVLTSTGSSAWPEDRSLSDQIPPEVEIERSFSPEPYGLYCRLTGRRDRKLAPALLASEPTGKMDALLRWLRLNLILPDARIGWIPFCFSSVLRALRRSRVDCILTSSPPHSLQLTGWLLKRWTGLPWVADLRDPWTEVEYYRHRRRSRPSQALDGAFERTCLRGADAIITTSRAYADHLRHKPGLHLGGKITVISNGIDPGDFGPAPRPSWQRFRIAHAGSLPASRNPETFFQALGECLRREPRLREKLELQIVGPVDPVVRKTIERAGLGPVLRESECLPYLESLSFLQESHLLLVPFPQKGETEIIVPAKLFDSMGARRPILAVGRPRGEGDAILTEWCGSGVVATGDVEGAKRRILEAFSDYLENRVENLPEIRERFHRNRLTSKLADVLDAVVKRHEDQSHPITGASGNPRGRESRDDTRRRSRQDGVSSLQDLRYTAGLLGNRPRSRPCWRT